VDVERVGHSLFGRRLRLQVLLWILNFKEPAFFLSEVAEGVHYSASGVSAELERLAALGMLNRHDALPGERRVYYSRTDSSLWAIIEAARIALLPRGDARSAAQDRGDAG
jgi:DNA-binding MarR family transcriptional regulator